MNNKSYLYLLVAAVIATSSVSSAQDMGLCLNPGCERNYTDRTVRISKCCADNSGGAHT
ncbi:hypothetical protein L914_21131 [Phytophthora nicotianae]|uniref:Phytotoxin PcF domain-containing protein n=1 Tax=Phytophthora nicotianae TaxID=4792 RepID=W2M6V3_PHYNI|nr:hypothetical protein L914_21131 [Phytophthora nicotianae]